MPEYDTTVDARNFIEKTQYEVEVDYDKEQNRPKKFIADLMPKIFDKVFNTKDILPYGQSPRGFQRVAFRKNSFCFIQKIITSKNSFRIRDGREKF